MNSQARTGVAAGVAVALELAAVTALAVGFALVDAFLPHAPTNARNRT
jgi:hypothetical protein